MRGEALRVRRATGVIFCALLLAGFTASAATPSALPSAARSWVDGDAEAAFAALEAAGPGRERDLNRAVIRLYMGQAAQAEADLAELHRRDPQWPPVLR